MLSSSGTPLWTSPWRVLLSAVRFLMGRLFFAAGYDSYLCYIGGSLFIDDPMRMLIHTTIQVLRIYKGIDGVSFKWIYWAVPITFDLIWRAVKSFHADVDWWMNVLLVDSRPLNDIHFYNHNNGIFIRMSQKNWTALYNNISAVYLIGSSCVTMYIAQYTSNKSSYLSISQFSLVYI